MATNRTPSGAGRKRSLQLLTTLCRETPEGGDKLVLKVKLAGQESTAAEWDLAELVGEDPERLLDEHVAEHCQEPGLFHYMLLMRDAEGKRANGEKAALRLRKTAGDANDAKSAGGGAEVATAAMGRAMASSFDRTAALLPKLSEAANNGGAGMLDRMFDLMDERQESTEFFMLEMSKLQVGLAEERLRGELEGESFWTTEAGQHVALAGTTVLLPLLTDLIEDYAAERKLKRRERARRLAAQEREDRRAAQPPSAQDPPAPAPAP